MFGTRPFASRLLPKHRLPGQPLRHRPLRAFLKAVLPIAALAAAFVATATLRARASDQADMDKLEVPEALERLLGKEADQDGQQHCHIRSGDLSYVGALNRLSCLMNALGINGATGHDGVTSALPAGYGMLVVHVQVDAGPFTVGSNTYAWKAQVWSCLPTADCTQTANFSPFIFWLFNNSTDGSVNNGQLAEQFSFFGGLASSGLHIVYDVGTNTSPTSLTALVVDSFPMFGDDDGSGTGTLTNNLIATRVDAHRTGTVLDFTQLLHSWRDSRLSVEVDTSTGAGGFYFESSRLGSLQPNATGDTPSPEACFTRTVSADGDDFDYLIVVDANGNPVTTGCSVATFPNYPESQLANETVTTASTLPGQSSPLGGMAANPPVVQPVTLPPPGDGD